MDAMEAILTRRSVRTYTDAPVPEDVTKALLEAAMSAPSAGNQQPWQFVVIDDRDTLNAITGVHPYANMLKHAPLAIVGNLLAGACLCPTLTTRPDGRGGARLAGWRLRPWRKHFTTALPTGSLM